MQADTVPTKNRRVVWVLGAGFSKSLGAPLLKDLFTWSFNVKISPLMDRRDLSQLASIYWGTENVDLHRLRNIENQPPPRAWDNAEEFLAYVDAAAQDDNAAQNTLTYGIGEKDKAFFETLSRWTRSYLAAACDHFIPPDPVSVLTQERWAPYKRWGQHLQPTDTVLTFNYDRVVEAATEAQNPLQEGNPRLRKLHGSVDWTLNPDDGSLTTCTPQEAYSGQIVPEIAAPGPDKSKRHPRIQRMWEAALYNVLPQADAIVFVGYGFPPTDNNARELLISGVRANKRPELVVRTVLGPPDDRSRRVEHMLRWALGRAQRRCDRLVVEPLYAEDFLGVFERNDLFELGHTV